MKFGIFFELSTPRPFSTAGEWSVYHNALEQCRLADALGFDHVWAVEHHFLEEYSHCSAPGSVPHCGCCANPAHPGRPRCGGLRAGDESSDPRRRTRRGTRHHLERPARIRHGAIVDVDRTRRLLGQSRRHEEDLGRVRARAAADVDPRRVRVAGQGVFDAVAQRVAETVSATASADVGDGDDAGYRTRCGGPGPRMSRRVGGRLRRAGATDEGISPAHRAVRAGGASSSTTRCTR